MDNVADLVTQPFRDIVALGNTATCNAGDDAPTMLKAARNLVKEGERALKRLEPLCNKLLQEFGTSFLDALKDNDEITDYRTQLADLLWGFEDYIEVESFEVENFAELQALARKVAPRINDILMRMKLATPIDKGKTISTIMNQLSPPSSPLPTPIDLNSESVAVSATDATSAAHNAMIHQQHETAQTLKHVDNDAGCAGDGLLTQPNSRGGCGDDISEARHFPPPIPPKLRPLPPPPPLLPTKNPWDLTASPSPEEEHAVADAGHLRRPEVLPKKVTDPPNQPASLEDDSRSERPRFNSDNSHYTVESFASGDHGRDQRHSVDYHDMSPRSTQMSNYHRVSAGWTIDNPIPEETSRDSENLGTPYSPESYVAHNRHFSGDSTDHNSTTLQSTSPGQSRFRQSPSRESLVDPLGNLRIVNTPGPSQMEIVTPVQEYTDGLIPVEPERQPTESTTTRLKSRRCNIGKSSSFYLARGFCEGAKEVVEGNIGVKKTRKPVGFTGAVTVARCVSCFFELSFEDIENDVNRLDKGTLSKQGIQYRLRFLQKSHVHSRRPEDILFGCVFCVQEQRTLHESDATVFFSREALFAHLARHPRPLPQVNGVSVVESPDVPAELHNDFDLHFVKPQLSHPAIEDAKDSRTSLPTGVARDHLRRTIGLRLLPDTPALEMMAGGRITGISWLPQHKGEWCMGWHDGVKATIPFNCLTLEALSNHDIRMTGTSLMRAKAKWRFDAKDKDKGPWLKFDKDEIITNISWPYAEHWCWSGTNAKGKWGIFPQAFIDTNTVQQLSATGSNRASSLNDEWKKSTSILPKFSSTRRKHGRPPSIAGSTSSSDAQHRASVTSTINSSGDRRFDDRSWR